MSNKLPKRRPETTTTYPQTPETKAKFKFGEQRISISPLPPASELILIEEKSPGAIERLLAMAELEQKERHKAKREVLELEKKVQRRSHFTEVLKIWIGFLAALATCGLCAYFAYLGDTKSASNAATIIIVGTASVFVVKKVFVGKNSAE